MGRPPDDAILIHAQPWHMLAYPFPPAVAHTVARAHARAALVRLGGAALYDGTRTTGSCRVRARLKTW